MRSILYILFAVGGILVAIALSMVLLDDKGGQQVKPQSPSIELSKLAAGKAKTLVLARITALACSRPMRRLQRL